ncbi:MAG: hypothetical protein WCP06_10355 [Verrucomicrobiota bacterium]
MEILTKTTRSRSKNNGGSKQIGCSYREARKPLGARLCRAWLLLSLLGVCPAGAVEWEFKPPRVGSVVPPSAWMVDRPLATVTISPEFTFPLQLVYFSSRSELGAFGGKWFCPQLESVVLPRGKGVLVWTLPSGSVVGLFAKKSKAGFFADGDHNYLGKVLGPLTTITSRDGWEYVYRNGRLATVHAPTGRQLEYEAAGGNLTQITFSDTASNQRRTVLTLTRQGNDRVVELAVNGTKYQFAYGNGKECRLLSLNRPGLRDPEKFEYTRDGLLSSLAVPGGAPLVFKSQFVKYGKGEPPPNDPAEKNKAGYWRLADDGVYSYTYENGAVTAHDRLGGWQSYGFAQNRGVETSRNSGGEELVKYYFRAPGRKHDGKLRRVEKNERVLLENFYDKKTGNLIESRDEAGVSTYYEYPIPVVASQADDPVFEKPVRILRANAKGGRDLVAAIEYDRAGRVLSRTEPGNKITKIAYNRRGEPESITDSAGVQTAMYRDDFGRLNRVVKGDQRQTIVYDDNGRVKSKVQPDGQVTEYTYDPAGNIAAAKQNGVTVTTCQRDANGAVTGQTDALGRSTRIERDARGNLIAEHQPNGTVTRYEYDDAGRRTAQIDGNGNRITFRYDLGGRLIEQKNPLGQTLTWTYDNEGRLVKRTNGVQTVTQTYNEKGRLKKIDYGAPGEKILYSYDALGRPKRISTPTNSVTLFYDEASRVIARQLTRGGIKRVVRYGWDAQGRKTSVTLSEKIAAPQPSANAAKPAAAPSAYRLLQQTEYAYDLKGHLLELKSNGVSVCRYQYDAKGRLSGRKYGNGIAAKYECDSFGRQTRLELTGGPLVKPLLLAYEWDNAGQLLSRTWNGQKQTYGYDPSGQLLTVRKSDPVPKAIIPAANTQPASGLDSALLESYQYDPAGNMLAKFENREATTMSYDRANQLSASITGNRTTAFQYDAAGRLVSQTASGQSQSRIYGFFDKLIAITMPDGNHIGYDYYPDGQTAVKGTIPKATFTATTGTVATHRDKTVGKMISDFCGTCPEENSPNLQQDAVNRNIMEEYVWDGPAMLYRTGTAFVIEPDAIGNVPIAMIDISKVNSLNYFLNDLTGTTLVVIRPDRVEVVSLETFDKPKSTPRIVRDQQPLNLFRK